MSPVRNMTPELRQAVQEALGTGGALNLRGGGSKAFYGRAPAGAPLTVAGHRGIVNYEPKELVLTALRDATAQIVELQEEAMGGMNLPDIGDLGDMLGGS